jgi:hypothetical protein
MNDETMIQFGSAVKNLGGGKIGGHLVLFSTKSDPDLGNDFFTASTDFDFEDGDNRSGYYNHGLDVKIANHKIGRGVLTRDELGVWLEAQLTERDAYADAVLKLVEEGALGLSSGALSHLVRREKATKGISEVTHWPIGEWSLTPTPAEPRTQAMSLKAWSESLSLKGKVLGDHVERSVIAAAMDNLNSALMSHVYSTLGDYADEKTTPDEKKSLLCSGLDEHCATGKKMVGAMMDGLDVKALLENVFTGTFAHEIKAATIRELEDALRDAGFSKRQATAIASHGFKGLQRDAASSVEPVTQNRTALLDARLKELQFFRERIA